MKTLFLDLSMGAAGDMLTAAVLSLLEDKEPFFTVMRQFERWEAKITFTAAQSKGIWGHKFNVLVKETMEESQDVDASGAPLNSSATANTEEHEIPHTSSPEQNFSHDHKHQLPHVHPDTNSHHNHHNDHSKHIHRSLSDVNDIIRELDLPPRVQADAIAVYKLLATAEAHSHQVPVHSIHFHEVGTLDAICDIVAFSLLIYLLNPETIIATPVSTGSGFVRCAHGILPVPAPATSYLLRKIPSYSGSIKGELLTPTGAALISHFVQEFREKPVGIWSQEGLGLGDKEYPALNAVRAWLGHRSAETSGLSTAHDFQLEQLKVLETDLDDMDGEGVAFVAEKLRQSGALDVSLLASIMKKGRPGIRISVLCRPAQLDKLLDLMMRHTSTLGIRVYDCERAYLEREIRTIDTPLGQVRSKRSHISDLQKEKIEFDDLARLADRDDLTLDQVRKILSEAKLSDPD
ncbi:MAG TPA: nickel pincer cofactor biosynthesis protein LarC [Clostridiaceae bacterium]|nr:nickel pincer cofactor biosynthesis protein LarC [Clostridiaceae bacterium]